MKGIVFGATGFLGSHTVEELTAGGHSVTVGVRETSDTSILDQDRITIIRLDFDDPREIEKSIEGQEVVFNCIADVRLHKPLATYRRTDVSVTRRVADAGARVGIRRFVQLSTIEIYGNPPEDPPFDETTLCAPEFPYQKAVWEREQAVLEVADRTGLEARILRPASALGPRNPPLERLVRAHARGVFPIIGKGTVPVSAVDPRDIGRAMLWLSQHPGPGAQVYLLRNFETSWLEIKEVLDELRNTRTKVRSLPVPLANALASFLEWITPHSREPFLTRFAVDAITTSHLYDDSKLRDTGFIPQYDLRDALANLLESMASEAVA